MESFKEIIKKIIPEKNNEEFFEENVELIKNMSLCVFCKHYNDCPIYKEFLELGKKHKVLFLIMDCEKFEKEGENI